MSALPQIHYRYWYFVPKYHSGKVYQIDTADPESCELWIDHQRAGYVYPRTRFPIDRDIEVLNRQEVGLNISLLLSLVASIFLTYLLIREDYGSSMSKTGIFAYFTLSSVIYFCLQCSKKCFEIANKVICTHERRDALYSYSDYTASSQYPQRRRVRA